MKQVLNYAFIIHWVIPQCGMKISLADGVRGTRTEGCFLPLLQDNIITHREGWRPRRPKRAFNQKNRDCFLYFIFILW